MSIDQAMVLAAGFGKRLQPLTLTTPKPLLPILKEPILGYVLDRLHRHGVKKIVVNTHYLASQLAAYLVTVSASQIIISHEPELLETGGGVLQALPYFEKRPFFVVNADIWWQETENASLLQRLEQKWDETTMDALLALIPKDQAIGFTGIGDYHMASDHRLKFREKNQTAPYIFSGVRILHPRLFDGAAPGPFPQTDLFHKAETKQQLHGLIHNNSWCDMGSLDTYKALEEYLQR